MTGEAAPTAEVVGEAGYVTPFPYVERLQPKMEELLDRRVPRAGRFCGFCYGRLREADAACGFCERPVGTPQAVVEVPQEVLRLYRDKQKGEARWVHLGAMFGLTLAAMLFVVLAVWGPGLLGHPAVSFTVLIGGGYLLAQLFGTLIGAQIGYRRAARRRDERWARYVEARDGVGSAR